MDQQTYQQRAHRLRRHAALDTTPGVQDTTPSAQDTTNHYKEERLIEELWRTIKEALKLEMTRSNYGTYIADTRTIAFDRDTGALVVEASSPLVVEASSPLVATQLNNYFYRPVLRAVSSTNASVHGLPIAAVDFIPRPQQPLNEVQTDTPNSSSGRR